MPYTVVSGDTLGKIAAANGTTVAELVKLNPKYKSNPNLIHIGDSIKLPADSGDEAGDEEAVDGEGATTQALPRNMKLVKIGNSFRAIWDLGGGLGWAWYDINREQRIDLFETANPAVDITLSNVGQFEATYGNNYWGNVGEVNLTADSPWEDLKQRIFGQFGYVPGFDDPQVQRLMIQAHFEDWDQNQFMVEYRSTDYFQTTTSDQRIWVGLSEAERNSRIQEVRAQLETTHLSIWGPNFTTNEAGITSQAQKIASGQMTMAEWEWTERQAAAQNEGTLEFLDRAQQAEALLAEGNEIENLSLLAEQQWNTWVGPVDMPADFANRWGNALASGESSQADLETYLKEVANGRWSFKPPNLTWADWSSTYKSQIKNTLELGSLDDSDSLLQSILSSDLNGVDLDQMIRSDDRFLSTERMFGELSTMAEDMGRRFGFIT